jgi:hypothetical protein
MSSIDNDRRHKKTKFSDDSEHNINQFSTPPRINIRNILRNQQKKINIKDFMSPLLTESNNIIYNIIGDNSKLTSYDNITYTTNMIYNYVFNNKIDETIISRMNDRQNMAIQVLQDFNFNSMIEEAIILTSILSVFENDKIDFNQFLNISENQKEMIHEMYNLIHNSSDNQLFWKLIPKQIVILSKINPYGMMDYINKVDRNNLFNELSQYLDIVSKYKCDFDNKYIKIFYNNSYYLINNIKSKMNKKITVDDIKDILF